MIDLSRLFGTIKRVAFLGLIFMAGYLVRYQHDRRIRRECDALSNYAEQLIYDVRVTFAGIALNLGKSNETD